MKKYLLLVILLMSSLAWAGSTTVVVGQGGGGAGDTSPAVRYPTDDTALGGINDAWTPSSGEDKWAMVDETSPDDDSTYIYYSDANSRQLFTYTDFAVPDGSTIDSVKVVARAKRADTYNVYLRHFVLINGTTYYENTTHSMTNSYATNTTTFTTNPATTNAWTVDEVNGVGTYALQEFGIGTYGMGAGETVNCTQVYIQVEFH